ncbi:hypothetical protein DERF_002622 [Dermatophagoides farinae]|uniref:Uncharacterized protein n=1 Tax=Dermatophagoides farinae TaxID=6954 RepID=A0A922LC49_DERFA|nr:hypothetical protein DERF_002622 [Dermatophagoides farinae]
MTTMKNKLGPSKIKLDGHHHYHYMGDNFKIFCHLINEKLQKLMATKISITLMIIDFATTIIKIINNFIQQNQKRPEKNV